MVADALAPCVARTSATMILCKIGKSWSYGMSVWRNDIKYKYMFMLQNLTCKELRDSFTELFIRWINLKSAKAADGSK